MLDFVFLFMRLITGQFSGFGREVTSEHTMITAKEQLLSCKVSNHLLCTV